MGGRVEGRLGWLPVVVAVAVAVNSLRLRGRVRAIPMIEPSTLPPHPSHRFLVADGVRLGEEQRRAASDYARRAGLTVLDLVPATMASHELLDFARMVDPTRLRARRLAAGRGAYQALLVHEEVLDRAGIQLTAPSGEGAALSRTRAGAVSATWGRAELAAMTATLRLHAATSMGLAVLPGLGSAAGSGGDRLAVQFAGYPWAPGLPFLPLLRDLTVAVGAAAAPGWAAGAALVSWLQPVLVGAGRIRVPAAELAASPLTRRRSLLRLLAAPVSGASVPRPWPPGPAAAELAATRRRYAADLAAGVGRFLEPAAAACPWCGGGTLSPAMVGSDCVQSKPGLFRYDRCADCGHVFQNPRLTLDGLEFYYRDVYSGFGGRLVEEVMRRNTDIYRDRASLDIPAPRRWLDVGTGFGHFCAIAAEVWPGTSFDGLDLGEGVVRAGRRGWVDRVYRGRLPELAERLDGQYGVVSMFHYLEHTREPREELAAAVRALAPGGHLLVEVPNPESPAARWYGPYWPGWLIPQHQHLLPADNLVAALEELGLKIVDLRFGAAHQGGDAPVALWGVWQRVAPSPAGPWRAEARPARAWARRVAVGAAVCAAMPAAVAWDAATLRYLRAGRRSNAYRVLAQLR